MEIEFISPINLLILYGILGFIFSSIVCLIETYFKCIGNEKKYFCHVTNIEENYDLYIDNFFIFFKNFSLLKSKEITIEIIIFFVGMIINVCAKYFDILIIKYLSPIYFVFTTLCANFLNEFIQLIRDIIEKVKSPNKNRYKEDLLRISIYICSSIGFMIYLEIIELNFCDLNYNLRKNITMKGCIDKDDDGEEEREKNHFIIISDEDENDEINSLSKDNIELSINKKK